MASAPGKTRVSTTITDYKYEQVKFWAKKQGITVNQFISEAISLAIDFQNGDYHISDQDGIVMGQLDQIRHGMADLNSNIVVMQKDVLSALDSLISLTRGDNYLLDTGDGDLG